MGLESEDSGQFLAHKYQPCTDDFAAAILPSVCDTRNIATVATNHDGLGESIRPNVRCLSADYTCPGRYAIARHCEPGVACATTAYPITGPQWRQVLANIHCHVGRPIRRYRRSRLCDMGQRTHCSIDRLLYVL
jgi:hypothetical protein